MQTSFHVSKENMEKICFMATIKPSRPVVGSPLHSPCLYSSSLHKAPHSALWTGSHLSYKGFNRHPSPTSKNNIFVKRVSLFIKDPGWGCGGKRTWCLQGTHGSGPVATRRMMVIMYMDKEGEKKKQDKMCKIVNLGKGHIGIHGTFPELWVCFQIKSEKREYSGKASFGSLFFYLTNLKSLELAVFKFSLTF